MNANQFSRGNAQVNPDFVNALVKASDAYAIVASQDIVDCRGLKLWARGKTVTSELQHRLLERRLQQPLEACLVAEDGVSSYFLVEKLEELLSSSVPMAKYLSSNAATLIAEAKSLPLHSVAQLLLTTTLATRPESFEHSVRAMALAGTLGQNLLERGESRLAMLGGLLHDIGEVYIHPSYLDSGNHLDLVGHKHIVVHPRVAQLLLSVATDYPTALSRAIGEHHERQNGSGYPARLDEKNISSLGSLLAVVETTLGIMKHSQAPLTRASFALRVIPGEFDIRWTSQIFNLAQLHENDIPKGDDSVDCINALSEINLKLTQTHELAMQVVTQRLNSSQQAIAELALNRISRIRTAWNALGIWGLGANNSEHEDFFEAAMARHELNVRLGELQRECLLLAERLDPLEREILIPLWEGFLVD